MLQYGLLVSGDLGFQCFMELKKSQEISFVFTDRGSITVIQECIENEIPHYVGNPRNEAVDDFLGRHNADVIFSINYLFLVKKNIISHARKYTINFHGSLLPKYRGRTPHVWAIINNEQVTGITAHLISEGCDEGDIVLQKTIAIGAETSGADVLNIYRSNYPSFINQVIDLIETDNLFPVPQEHQRATYFGKRTPEDGEINWDWQKERIKNWVRAMARPYPGAFTFYEGSKVVIHNLEFSEVGYDWIDENGKVLSTENGLIVKTPNGAVKITDIEFDLPHNFVKGKVLHGRNTYR